MLPVDERRNRYMCDCWRAVNWRRGQARLWKGHIVIVSIPFLILPRDRRNATRHAPKHFNGKAALGYVSIGEVLI